MNPTIIYPPTEIWLVPSLALGRALVPEAGVRLDSLLRRIYGIEVQPLPKVFRFKYYSIHGPDAPPPWGVLEASTDSKELARIDDMGLLVMTLALFRSLGRKDHNTFILITESKGSGANRRTTYTSFCMPTELVPYDEELSRGNLKFIRELPDVASICHTGNNTYIDRTDTWCNISQVLTVHIKDQNRTDVRDFAPSHGGVEVNTPLHPA